MRRLAQLLKRLPTVMPAYDYDGEQGYNPYFQLAGEGAYPMNENECRIFALREGGEVALGVKNAYEETRAEVSLRETVPEADAGLVDWGDRYGHPSLLRRDDGSTMPAHFAGWVAQRDGLMQVLDISGRYGDAYAGQSIFGQTILELSAAEQFIEAYGYSPIEFCAFNGHGGVDGGALLLGSFLVNGQAAVREFSSSFTYPEEFLYKCCQANQFADAKRGDRVNLFVLAVCFSKLLEAISREVGYEERASINVLRETLMKGSEGPAFREALAKTLLKLKRSESSFVQTELNRIPKEVMSSLDPVLGEFPVMVIKQRLRKFVQQMIIEVPNLEKKAVLKKLYRAISQTEFPEGKPGAAYLVDYFALVKRTLRHRVGFMGDGIYKKYSNEINRMDRFFVYQCEVEVPDELYKAGDYGFFDRVPAFMKEQKIITYDRLERRFEDVVHALRVKHTSDEPAQAVELDLSLRKGSSG